MLRALPATAPSSPPRPGTCPRPCWTRLPRAASAWCRSSCVAATPAQVIRRPELGRHRADAPSLVLAVRLRRRAPDGLVKVQAQQWLRQVLPDMSDAQAAGQDAAARVRVGLPRGAAQQRWLPAAVAGNQADPVTRTEAESDILEERPRRDHANVAQADECHVHARSSAGHGVWRAVATRAVRVGSGSASVGAALQRLSQGGNGATRVTLVVIVHPALP